MQEVSLFETFTSPLISSGIPYCITGSVAATLYGEPRLTHDIDIVIHIASINSIKKLIEVFPQKEFYLPPEEIIRIEFAREMRGHFNIIHLDSGYKADMYLAGKDEFQHWAMDNARRVAAFGAILSVAPPEYVIIKKLQFYKEGGSDKHLRDIRGILQNPDNNLNLDQLRHWVNNYGLQAEWANLN